jgi:hypothetical protein
MERAGCAPISNFMTLDYINSFMECMRQPGVGAASIFKGDIRQWEKLLRIGD